jgi:hypothetical protein
VDRIFLLTEGTHLGLAPIIPRRAVAVVVLKEPPVLTGVAPTYWPFP